VIGPRSIGSIESYWGVGGLNILAVEYTLESGNMGKIVTANLSNSKREVNDEAYLSVGEMGRVGSVQLY